MNDFRSNRNRSMGTADQRRASAGEMDGVVALPQGAETANSG